MDNIAMINGREAMAYQGEMPWHKLGVRMDGLPDVIAALSAANLDWNVGLEPVHLPDGVTIPNRFATVRDVDRTVLGVVSDEYEVLQNSEAFGVLQPACEEFGVTIESAGALGIGQKVWMLAKLPETVEPVPGDEVDGYFLVSTGHNGSIPFAARPTPVRVVCENTLTMAESSGASMIRLNHIRSDMKNMDLVKKLIKRLIHMIQVTGETFSSIAAKKMSSEEIQNYINAVLGISETDVFIQEALGIDKVETAITKRSDMIFNLVWNGRGAELAGAKKKSGEATAWAAYNAIAEYYDHVRPAELKTEKAIRMANKSAIFGANSRVKENALALALAA